MKDGARAGAINILWNTDGSFRKDESILLYITMANMLREEPFISLSDLSTRLNLPRSVVSTYLEKMYADSRFVGPMISVNPHQNYPVYLSLINFADPYEACETLKSSPSVKNLAISSGRWNTSILADRKMDFTQMKGFREMVFSGERYESSSPQVLYTTGDYWSTIEEKVTHCTVHREIQPRRILPHLYWGEEEWHLYDALRSNVRQDVSAVLHNHHSTGETLHRWKETLQRHCNVHMGFYPQGLDAYMHFCVLFRTAYIHPVKELFSFFPTTPFYTDVDEHVLVQVRITCEMRRRIGELLYVMKERGIVEDALCAMMLSIL
jgi:hypothetical protein